jgi:P-type Ca2+ transporter type 2C
VTTPTGAPAPGLVPSTDGLVWHALSADRALAAGRVHERNGLSSAEAASRAQRFGPNAFGAGKAESHWHVFLRQYADPMQIVLLAADTNVTRAAGEFVVTATARAAE